MRAADGGLEFDIDVSDLRGFLAQVRDFSPKLATDVRRELRRSGESIIAAQRAILEGPKPGGIRKTGQQYRLVFPKNGGKPYLARRNIYATSDSHSGESTGLREAIAAGLATRVSTGKTRQGVTVRTTRSKAPMSITWQASVFRAQNWGRDDRHDQQGQPYFFGPIKAGQEAARQRINDVLDDALQRLARD